MYSILVINDYLLTIIMQKKPSRMWAIKKTTKEGSYDVVLNKDYELPAKFNGTIKITQKNCPPAMNPANQRTLDGWHHMFDGRPDIKEVIFDRDIDTSHVTSTRCMFHKCENLERIVLPDFAFQNVINASYMFEDCPKLKEIIGRGLFLSKNIDGSFSLNKFVEELTEDIIKNTPIPTNACPVGLNILAKRI